LNELESEKAITLLCSELTHSPSELDKLIPLRELMDVLQASLTNKELLWLSILTSVNKRLNAFNIAERDTQKSPEDLTVLLETVDLLFHEPISNFKRPDISKAYLEVS